MSKSKLSVALNTILTLVSLFITMKFGLSVEAMIAAVIEHVKLGTELLTVLREPRFSMLIPYTIVALFGMIHFYGYGMDVGVYVMKKLHLSKEEKDTKEFIRWVKKEQKRLRKLEGTW